MAKGSTFNQSLFLLLFIVVLVTPSLLFAADLTVKGRVFTEDGPFPGAKVYIYASFADLQSEKTPVATVTTDRDGVYAVTLKPAPYYFVARGERNGNKYYAYHGSNPIKIASDKLWLALLANQDKPVTYVDGATGFEGRITFKGKPVDGAYVALYNPGKKNKGLGVKTESAAKDGSFKMAALPGSYVIQAKKNFKGKSNRPLQKGDLFCYNPYNPLEAKEGKTTRVELPCFPVNDRTAFAVAPMVKGDDYKTFADSRKSADSGIRGRVVDPKGKPISNMVVQAYMLTAPVTQMYHFAHGTEYGTITDDDGKFFIPIDESGDYGVITRNILGDGPHRGEVFGFYQGNSRYAVPFKQGTMVDNINILADEVMQPAPTSDTKREELIVGTKVGEPALVNDSVIDRDTVWQGEIIISGVVSVKRGATLTLRPGTVVKFKKVDKDNNKVGDGEIMVEGRLIAKGTSDQRIIFTSGEEKPKKNDWSYVQFISSDSGNVIENCTFEYAYSGMMIHYANVAISDSLFQKNRRGIHFTSTDMPLDHCTFVDNEIGVYFVRFEGDVRFTNNEITRNDIGVQFVKQHINLVDFETLDQGNEPPKFSGNNIYNNSKYNFSLGVEQDRDMSVAGNWWGTTQKQAIADLIYDRSKDPALGQITFEPYLQEPVKGTGVRKLVEPGKKR